MTTTMVIDLRGLRVNRGLGLGEAAEQMGVDRDTLARAEGGRTRPHPRNAVRIASFYGLQATDVWPTRPEAA